MSKEPAVLISTVSAFLTAILGLGVAFGAEITDDQKNAILGVVAAVVPIIALIGPLIRGFVYSPKSYGDAVGKAHDAGIQNETLQIPQP